MAILVLRRELVGVGFAAMKTTLIALLALGLCLVGVVIAKNPFFKEP